MAYLPQNSRSRVLAFLGDPDVVSFLIFRRQLLATLELGQAHDNIVSFKSVAILVRLENRVDGHCD